MKWLGGIPKLHLKGVKGASFVTALAHPRSVFTVDVEVASVASLVVAERTARLPLTWRTPEFEPLRSKVFLWLQGLERSFGRCWLR